MTRRIPWVPLVMVGLFVAAVAYVNPFDAGRDAPPRPAAGHAAHGDVADGLSDNHDGYLLSPVALPDRRGDAIPLAFRIIGPGGAPATAFDAVGSEPLHLYVLRDDLSFYQHLHPTLAGDTWTAAVKVPDGGVYRLYAEFVPKGGAGGQHPTVLGTPFVIAGDTRYVPLPAPASRVRAGRFTVSRLEGTADAAAGRPDIMRFQVRDARGAPVTALEPYLGVYAHASVFDSTTQRLTHLHPTTPANTRAAPADGVLTFHTQFPQRGRHRVFLQFKVAGAVHQAAFTVIVR
ncbi:hypothetical protein ACTMTJ_40770 [Phytohabitans sp. LJ34]|uniref:hypothetical protein n=1 Tax=Phytohabitans sp. LJ34 TaxID=3452217 RepID=UPI003F889E3F